MSEFMLSDQDTIDDVNPFVSRDFSLPGGVRQTGDFEDFEEVRPGKKKSRHLAVFSVNMVCVALRRRVILEPLSIISTPVGT